MNQSNFKPTFVLIHILVVFFILLPGSACKVQTAFAAKTEDSVRLTEEEKSWLEAHPVIRLAPDPSFQPIEFFDENGNYAGIGADYVRLIEKKLDISFEIIRCSNWDDVISRMKRREVDVLNAVVRTPQREQYMQFSTPYLTIPSVIVVRKNVDRHLTLEMLEGMKVVMVSGYGYVDLIHNQFPQLNIELVPDLKAALRKVSFGMADAFVGDLATASFYIESEGITNLRLAGETDPPNISGFAVRSDWPELSGILEKAISLVTDEERKTIFEKWIHLESEPGISMIELRNLVLIVVGIVALIITGFLLWNRSLRLMVHRRTESLQKEIEERNRTEKELRESEERLQLVMEGSQLGYWDWNIETGEVNRNARWAEMLGYSLPEIEFSVKQWTDLHHPDDRDTAWNSLQDHLDGKTPVHRIEYRMRAKDGNYKWILDQARVVKRDAGGKPLRMCGTHTDISEHKREEKEKAKLQAQLAQAQKMESVGRLAGGVAHDFNNMLSVIMGRSEMLLADAEPGQKLYRDLLEIKGAAQRSADVTRQLLAFARKQTIAPKVIDFNEAIENILKMLRRLIGEDIELLWHPGKELWPVKMDPSQLDQILANLSVNARDAITNTGRLIIETCNVTVDKTYCDNHPGSSLGDFVQVTVSDNGCGMDRETLNNLFEPFFTTKDADKGTGLGLATVYGIVKQNSGYINVYSEPGKGTSFKIYLPRHAATGETAPAKDKAEAILRGSESILLVEDEMSILEMTEQMLKLLGYTVLSANKPGEAIALARKHKGEIHLLLTDVVMPEMNGQDLLKGLLQIYPNLKSLFMSGYTENVIAHHGVLDKGIHYLQKPFSRQALSVKLREVLENNDS